MSSFDYQYQIKFSHIKDDGFVEILTVTHLSNSKVHKRAEKEFLKQTSYKNINIFSVKMA